MFEKFEELDDKTKSYLILGGAALVGIAFVCVTTKMQQDIITRGVMKAIEKSDKLIYVVPKIVPQLLADGAKIHGL